MKLTLKSRKTVVVVATVAIAMVGLFYVQSVEGQSQDRRLVSAPVIAQPGDTAHVMVTNLGKRPIRVRALVVDAISLDLIDEDGPEVVPPGTGTSFSVEFMGTDPTSFLVVLGLQSAQGGMSGFTRVSVQVVDGAGKTRIFTDGFESGDVSA